MYLQLFCVCKAFTHFCSQFFLIVFWLYLSISAFFLPRCLFFWFHLKFSRQIFVFENRMFVFAGLFGFAMNECVCMVFVSYKLDALCTTNVISGFAVCLKNNTFSFSCFFFSLFTHLKQLVEFVYICISFLNLLHIFLAWLSCKIITIIKCSKETKNICTWRVSTLHVFIRFVNTEDIYPC